MATEVSQPSEFRSFEQHQRSGSMSVGAMATTADNGGGDSAAGAAAPAIAAATPASSAANTEVERQVQEVLQSEMGISTLLTRLKQTITSAKEFALFLKKRATLEEEHALGLRKLCKMTQDTMLRPDHKQGTFAEAYYNMMAIHDKIAQNGLQFASSLQQMHDDLVELAAIAEKNRKGWKQNGLAAEHKVAEIEAAMRKSKAKYDSLAEEYDRVRTGDTSQKGGKMFGFKGPKSAAQHEEDMLRKVQGADQDYHSKVDMYQAERAELVQSTRPEAVKALQDIVRECDAGLSLQIQKFASFNEKLLLSNGLSISPLKKEGDTKSLREVVTAINNDRDFNDFLSGHFKQLPPRTGQPKYERHPVLSGPSHTTPNAHIMSGAIPQQAQTFGSSVGQYQISPQQFNTQSPQGAPGQGIGSPIGPIPTMPAAQRPSSRGGQHERSFSHGSVLSHQSSMPQQQQPQQFPGGRNSAQSAIPGSRFNGNISSQGPPQLGALAFQSAQQPQPQPQPQPQSQPQQQQQQPQQLQQQPSFQPPTNPLMSHPPNERPGSSGFGGPGRHSPPQGSSSRPVFGLSLARLYERDGLAVPQVVYQCITAVDFYGLTVEGIYRLSGSVPHVNKLKGMFDTDSNSPNLDFRNPENFFHDVNSVAGLLKQFLRDLPDPIMTREHYSGFIEAAKQEDEIVRRDSLHAIINNLPDPNYATLRALTLHLHRVTENSHVNRMNTQNLAIVFGPTLMGTGAQSDIADAGWQVRVVETVLQNTLQIFDED